MSAQSEWWKRHRAELTVVVHNTYQSQRFHPKRGSGRYSWVLAVSQRWCILLLDNWTVPPSAQLTGELSGRVSEVATKHIQSTLGLHSWALCSPLCCILLREVSQVTCFSLHQIHEWSVVKVEKQGWRCPFCLMERLKHAHEWNIRLQKNVSNPKMSHTAPHDLTALCDT